MGLNIQIFFSFLVTVFIIISIMGQQCCSEENADTRTFNNTSSNFQKTANFKEINPTHETVEQEFTYVRNFPPVQKIPKIDKTVLSIQEKLGQFEPSPKLEIPEGISEPQAYAINNSGLIYDANSEWRDGVPNGRGRLIYPDGSTYTGTFLKGVPHGQGRFISKQGWYYEGQLAKQQAEGAGVFAFENIGYRYEGEWDGDLPNGKGKETWIKPGRTSVYEGQFVGGKKNGKGKYKSGDEWQYEGDFSNNEITSSKGIMRYKNGQIYHGDFHQGRKHGFGTYKWVDGSTFEGWYSDDKKQGHGKFRSADNKIFEGEWKNGKREGRGLLIVGGKKYPGIWKNDLPQSNKAI